MDQDRDRLVALLPLLNSSLEVILPCTAEEKCGGARSKTQTPPKLVNCKDMVNVSWSTEVSALHVFVEAVAVLGQAAGREGSADDELRRWRKGGAWVRVDGDNAPTVPRLPSRTNAHPHGRGSKLKVVESK